MGTSTTARTTTDAVAVPPPRGVGGNAGDVPGPFPPEGCEPGSLEGGGCGR